MGEIINLRQARKKKQANEKEKRAQENRARHGASKAQKQKIKQEQTRKKQLLDDHAIEKDAPSTNPDALAPSDDNKDK